jgi:hypothetical protein
MRRVEARVVARPVMLQSEMTRGHVIRQCPTGHQSPLGTEWLIERASLRSARRACTLPAVRNLFWQRLALMLLLIGRLVIGELPHAMPNHDGSMGSDAHGAHHSADASSGVFEAVVTCAEHETARSRAPATPHSDHTVSDAEQNCCDTGECACPCLHAPCAVLDDLVSISFAATFLRYPRGEGGLLAERPSRLFRPPALIS